jgi:hypothetical protein
MSSKSAILSGFVVVIGLICFAIVPASAKDNSEKKENVEVVTGACVVGYVPKKQADGSWACEEDTSAASVCDLGEVYVANGLGSGGCISLLDSDCPCGSALEMLQALPWADDANECVPIQLDSGDGVCNGEEDEFCSLEVRDDIGFGFGIELVDFLEFFTNDRDTVCSQNWPGGGEVHTNLSQLEWDACVHEALALADAVGAVCSFTPVVGGLP